MVAAGSMFVSIARHDRKRVILSSSLSFLTSTDLYGCIPRPLCMIRRTVRSPISSALKIFLAERLGDRATVSLTVATLPNVLVRSGFERAF